MLITLVAAPAAGQNSKMMPDNSDPSARATLDSGGCKAFSDKAGEACREIENEYRRLAQAVAKDDKETARAILDPGYTELATSGVTFDLDEVIFQWRLWSNGGAGSIQTSIEHLDAAGEDAKVRVHSTFLEASATDSANDRTVMVNLDHWSKKATDGV